MLGCRRAFLQGPETCTQKWTEKSPLTLLITPALVLCEKGVVPQTAS